MKKVTIYFKASSGGGIAVTEVPDSNTPLNIGQRMINGGFITFSDGNWSAGREGVIDLSEVYLVEFTGE